MMAGNLIRGRVERGRPVAWGMRPVSGFHFPTGGVGFSFAMAHVFYSKLVF